MVTGPNRENRVREISLGNSYLMRCQEGLKWTGQDECERFWREESENWCQSGKVGHKQEGEKMTSRFGRAASLGEDKFPFRHKDLVGKASISFLRAKPGLLWQSLQDSVGTSCEVLECQPDYAAREMVLWFSREGTPLSTDKISGITMRKGWLENYWNLKHWYSVSTGET